MGKKRKTLEELQEANSSSRGGHQQQRQLASGEPKKAKMDGFPCSPAGFKLVEGWAWDNYQFLGRLQIYVRVI